jgi:hypothetical protein
VRVRLVAQAGRLRERVAMKPSIGRTLHYNVPGIGWRPLLVTGVVHPVRSVDGPLHVSGWAKLDPGDLTWGDGICTYKSDGEAFVGTEMPVENSYEGERERNWRWPPRVS